MDGSPGSGRGEIRFKSRRSDLADSPQGLRCLNSSLFASEDGEYYSYTVKNSEEQDKYESEVYFGTNIKEKLMLDVFGGDSSDTETESVSQDSNGTRVQDDDVVRSGGRHDKTDQTERTNKHGVCVELRQESPSAGNELGSNGEDAGKTATHGKDHHKGVIQNPR